MITLSDIAKRANVNSTTVSKALRNSGDLSHETIKRIQKISKEMGYSTKKTRLSLDLVSVGIVCPEILSSYYARVLSTLLDNLRQKNIEVLFSLSEFEASREQNLINVFTDKSVNAIICITEHEDISQVIKNISEERKIPIIQIASNVQSEYFDNVFVDEKIGIKLAMEHIVSLGHKKIAFFGEKYSQQRLRYFKSALIDYNVPLYDELIMLNTTRHFECGYDLMSKVLSMESEEAMPTAIFAEYDDIALGAMRRISEAGMSVPEDFSIIGFDDADYCRFLPVALTTISSHVKEICDITTEILFKKIYNSDYKLIQNISIIPEFVVRETTAKPSEKRS